MRVLGLLALVIMILALFGLIGPVTSPASAPSIAISSGDLRTSADIAVAQADAADRAASARATEISRAATAIAYAPTQQHASLIATQEARLSDIRIQYEQEAAALDVLSRTIAISSAAELAAIDAERQRVELAERDARLPVERAHAQATATAVSVASLREQGYVSFWDWVIVIGALIFGVAISGLVLVVIGSGLAGIYKRNVNAVRVEPDGTIIRGTLFGVAIDPPGADDEEPEVELDEPEDDMSENKIVSLTLDLLALSDRKHKADPRRIASQDTAQKEIRMHPTTHSTIINWLSDRAGVVITNDGTYCGIEYPDRKAIYMAILTRKLKPPQTNPPTPAEAGVGE